MKKCANCGALVVFGKKDGENHYCDAICMEFHQHPGFCHECAAETTDESPGGTFTMNGVGTRLYGGAAKCPTCRSVIKRKWVCFVFIPVIPLKKFRIKPVTHIRYLGRRIPEEAIRGSHMRVSAAIK